jgi:hypothetical protein
VPAALHFPTATIQPIFFANYSQETKSRHISPAMGLDYHPNYGGKTSPPLPRSSYIYTPSCEGLTRRVVDMIACLPLFPTAHIIRLPRKGLCDYIFCIFLISYFCSLLPRIIAFFQ